MENLKMVSGGTAALFLQGAVFWPYFAGAAISVTGAIAARNEVLLAAGADKLVSLGRLFYTMPMAVFGAEHFTATKEISQLIPKWIPGATFWTYFVGAALFAAALSFVTKKYGRWSGTLLGLMFFLFVALMHVPASLLEPKDRVGWVVALRDLSFSGGALAFAATQAEPWPGKWRTALREVSRIFIGATTLFFAVQQLLHPEMVPGVPLERETPAWIPGRIFWGYLTGVVFLVVGGRLLLKWQARQAALTLGIMVLILIVAVYLPIWGASLSSIQDGLNYFADTLMFAGAALLLAQALPKEAHGHV